MFSGPSQNITGLLLDWQQGDQSAIEKLTPIIYDELRRIAHRYVRRERQDHTLETTALVNEAYLRVAGQQQTQWQNRAHLFAVPPPVMRHILVGHARLPEGLKDGGGGQTDR